jgi:hypothetical protein
VTACLCAHGLAVAAQLTTRHHGRAHDHHAVHQPEGHDAPPHAGSRAGRRGRVAACRRRQPRVGGPGRGRPRRDAAHAARADRAAPGGHGPAAPRRPVASGQHRGPRALPRADGHRLVPRPGRRAVPGGALDAGQGTSGVPRRRGIQRSGPPWGRSLPATWALRYGGRAGGCLSSCSRTARTATRETTPSWSRSSPATDTQL